MSFLPNTRRLLEDAELRRLYNLVNTTLSKDVHSIVREPYTDDHDDDIFSVPNPNETTENTPIKINKDLVIENSKTPWRLRIIALVLFISVSILVIYYVLSSCSSKDNHPRIAKGD